MSDREGMVDRVAWKAPALTGRIVTDRLVLRPPRTTDLPELRRAMRSNAEHLRPWSAAPARGEDPTSLAALSRAIVRYRREWKRGQAYVFVMTPRDDDGRVLGRVALGGVLRGAFGCAHLGYWIDAGHQGRGLMTEAVRAVTRFGFGAGGLHRVQAAVMPSNVGSLRVLAKAGYRREGVAERYLAIAGRWEDHVLLAMTSEECPEG